MEVSSIVRILINYKTKEHAAVLRGNKTKELKTK